MIDREARNAMTRDVVRILDGLSNDEFVAWATGSLLDLQVEVEDE